MLVHCPTYIPQSRLSTHFTRAYFTSDQISEESVDVVLHQFWEVDSSGVQSLPVMTVEDKIALDKVQKSIEFVDGHYQMAIPYRKDKLSIPINYKMPLERLQKLEKPFRRIQILLVHTMTLLETYSKRLW